MANNIKGITVEIGGDTTKLGKALEDVNKRSRDLSSELGEINKLLRLDPGNADLLAQKQRILAQQVENTSEKLKILKEAERQVQEQFERGEASEEQVRALQREIISTSNKLNTYENALGETNEEMSKLGNSTESAEKDVDALGDEVKTAGNNLDDGSDKASKFGNAVKKAGEVALAGLKVVGVGITASVGALTGATVSASAYADEMLTMSSVTGVSTEKLQAYQYASELVDVSTETLTKSMAKNIKSMSSASQGSKAYADAYSKLGVSVTDANGNLRDGEEVYWESIDALGKISNETERDALAMQLFGKSAQELNPLIEAGSEKMKELTQEAKDVGAVMSEDSLEALGAFDDSLQRLKGGAEASKNALGGVLLPELQLLTDTGGGLLNEFTQKLNASGGGLDGLATVIDEMSGTVASTLTDLVSQLVSKASTLLPSLTSTAISLITSLVTSLIGMLPQLIECGLQMILAIINGITTAIPQIVSAIVGMIPQLVNALTTAIPQLIQGVVSLVMAIVDAIPQILPPLIQAIPTIVMSIVNALVEATPQLLQGAIQLLLAIVDAIPLLIQTLVPLIPQIITAVVNCLLDNIPILIDGAITLFFAILEAIPVIVKELIKAVPQIITAIISVLKTLPSRIWNIFKQVISRVGEWGSNMRAKAGEAIRNMISRVVETARQLPSKIWNAIVGCFQRVTAWGTQMVSKAKSAIKKVADSIVNGLKSLPSKLKTVGKNLVEGLWNGIKNMAGWIKSKISGFGKDILNKLKNFFGIKSPSRLMRDQVGKYIAEGIGTGVTENADKPITAVEELGDDMLASAENINGATINRKLTTTFTSDASKSAVSIGEVLNSLDNIYDRLGRLQMVLDSGVLVGELLDKIDAGLADKQLLSARGV